MFCVSDMFLISLLKTATGLSDVWHLACVTCKFIDSTFVLFLCIVGYFWFCELLWGVGVRIGYSHICVFEYVIDFSYYWVVVLYVNVVHISFLFLSLIWSWLVGLYNCCCRSVLGKLFCAISCIDVLSLSLSLSLFKDVSWRECILVTWCLNAAILCSMG